MRFWTVNANRRSRLYFGLVLFLVAGLAFTIAFEWWAEQELAAIPGQPTTPPPGKVTLIVKIPSRLLEVYNDGTLYKRYQIAVGKRNTPTPIGDWTIIWKAYHSGDIFGTRFMGLDVPWGGYGIHGTNQPWSIGQFASHGCIRLRNKDIEELFEWVPVGTPVRIEDRQERILRTLQYAMSGPDVVRLQNKLKKLGYLEGRAEGFFNRDTQEALKRFQFDRGLKPSGIADRKTLDLLGV
ncbi:MAG TPA: L,D-transpeptidase family protein [Selenomonadales bacterium]|nr:L,D-transpeptidase family protein [Selenomonadales bacterium]